MPTLGPQIVTGSYGNLLKFLPVGEAGVTTSQVQITDGKGKVTPLQLATGSVYVSGTLSSSAEVVFSGLTSTSTLGQYVSFDTSDGRLYYSNTSSIQNVVSASYAVSAAFAPNDGDWTIGATFMTASGREDVYIPCKLENGLRNFAQGNDSHAEGSHSLSSGQFSHAEGRATSASGYGSHAEGVETNSPGAAAHAEGKGTIAGVGLGDGDLAHAEGHFTKALSFASHAEGNNTYASASYAHAEGNSTSASGESSHAEGDQTIASGINSHAEGKYTIASQTGAHAEGYQTLASSYYSHAEGIFTTASGAESHAEGRNTSTIGLYSHAEGINTLATGEASHAEGQSSKANGIGSHAEGKKTTAQADNSHAGGLGTWANKEDQTVVGQFNVFNQALGPFHDSTFVVGTGTSDSQRADGLTVKRNTHEVAVMQQASQDYPALSDQNGPGLYFGKPEAPYSNRIVSIENFGPFSGTMLFQFHDGVKYNDMVQVTSSAVFVPDP